MFGSFWDHCWIRVILLGSDVDRAWIVWDHVWIVLKPYVGICVDLFWILFWSLVRFGIDLGSSWVDVSIVLGSCVDRLWVGVGPLFDNWQICWDRCGNTC